MVNRLLLRLMAEIFAAVDEGTPVEVADAALRALGLPMSPVRAAPAGRSRLSPSTCWKICTRPSAIASRSRPTCRHWWLQEGPASMTGPPTARHTSATRRRSCWPSAISQARPDQVRERALTALAEEIGLMLDEAVVAAPMDIDLCLILGAGWPFHLGGITPYLDREGISERVHGHRFLPPGVASVPG